jgi:apolipoprotein D and lipocalin family protein
MSYPDRQVRKRSTIALLTVVFLGACAGRHPEMATVDSVELERFMGRWYVIANIPTFIEKDAYNAVETYSLNEDGTIDTVFTFHKGGFDGEPKRYNPKGFVRDTQSNALWGMRFIWPIKADYRIVYVAEDYSQTVIARKKRDFIWIMARTPTIPDEDYEDLLALAADLGYDTSEILLAPQKW